MQRKCNRHAIEQEGGAILMCNVLGKGNLSPLYYFVRLGKFFFFRVFLVNRVVWTIPFLSSSSPLLSLVNFFEQNKIHREMLILHEGREMRSDRWRKENISGWFSTVHSCLSPDASKYFGRTTETFNLIKRRWSKKNGFAAHQLMTPFADNQQHQQQYHSPFLRMCVCFCLFCHSLLESFERRLILVLLLSHQHNRTLGTSFCLHVILWELRTKVCFVHGSSW